MHYKCLAKKIGGASRCGPVSKRHRRNESMAQNARSLNLAAFGEEIVW